MLAQGFDVVVVGARCAGSPLAAMLSRQGVNVAVVERATFPRDTLSTHIFEADGLAFLDRLGVTDQLRATGAPFEVVDVAEEHLRSVYGRDLILLRPDLHVVWRGDAGPSDSRQVAAVATGRNRSATLSSRSGA
mgnify:CR=1 FL=1